MLNDAQREAVTHLSGPMLVVAGPGSGKTRVITTRGWLYLIQQGVQPRGTCWPLPSPTGRRGRLARPGSRRWAWPGGVTQICTFHSLVRPAPAGVRRRGAWPLKRSYTIYDTADQTRNCAKLATSSGPSVKQCRLHPRQGSGRAASAGPYAMQLKTKNRGIDPKTEADRRRLIPRPSSWPKVYQRLRQSAGRPPPARSTFDDLLTLRMVFLFRTNGRTCFRRAQDRFGTSTC